MLPPFLPPSSTLHLPSSLLRRQRAPLPQSVLAPEANREVDHHGARKQVNRTFSLNSGCDGGGGGDEYGGDGGGGEVDHHGARKQVANFSLLVVVMLCGGSNGD